MVTQTEMQRMGSQQLSAFAFVLLLTPYLTLMAMQPQTSSVNKPSHSHL